MSIIKKLQGIQEKYATRTKPRMNTVLNFRSWKDKYHLYIIAWYFKVLPTNKNGYSYITNSNYNYFTINKLLELIVSDFLDNDDVKTIVKDCLKNESDIRRQILNAGKTLLVKEALINTFDMADQERELNK